MKRKMKKPLKITLIILASVIALAGVLFGVYSIFLNPYRGTDGSVITAPLDTALTLEQAQTDLDFTYERICERHPAWLDGSDELCARVHDIYIAEREALTDGMTVLELWQSCSRIAAAIGDGHTWVLSMPSERRYIDDFSALRDVTVTHIDREPIEDIFARFREIYPCETDSYARAVFSGSIVYSEDYLAWCGVDVSDGVTFTLEDAQGESGEHHFSFVLPEDSGESEYVLCSWEIDEEHSIGLFDLNSCECSDVYLDSLEAFFAEVEKAGCSTVVVDLRGNGGGNSLVANEFLRYIDVESYREWDYAMRIGDMLIWDEAEVRPNRRHDNAFSGDVYVLTDVYTYSSAMDFAMIIGDNGIGQIVGEASGNMPDSYGDCLYFALPESGLRLSVSYKKWTRIDSEKSGQPLEPHIPCDPDYAYEKVCGLF